jgi:hypothetical protein
VKLSSIKVYISLLLLFFSFKKRLLAAMTVRVTMFMRVVVAMTMIVTSKDSHLNNVKDEATYSGDKHDIFLDFRWSKKSFIGSKKEKDCDTP